MPTPSAVEHQQRRSVVLQGGLHPRVESRSPRLDRTLQGHGSATRGFEVVLQLVEEAASLGGVLGEVGESSRARSRRRHSARSAMSRTAPRGPCRRATGGSAVFEVCTSWARTLSAGGEHVDHRRSPPRRAAGIAVISDSSSREVTTAARAGLGQSVDDSGEIVAGLRRHMAFQHRRPHGRTGPRRRRSGRSVASSRETGDRAPRTAADTAIGRHRADPITSWDVGLVERLQRWGRASAPHAPSGSRPDTRSDTAPRTHRRVRGPGPAS